MAKKQHIPRNAQMYNRQTKGYQRNLMKNMPDMEMPKMADRKKLLALNITVGVVAIILIILGIKFVAIWTGIIPLLLVALYLLGVMRYMNKKQKEIIAYYQKMGMNKKRFIQQVNMQNKDKKEKNRQSNNRFYNRMWDIAAMEEKGIKPNLSFLEKVLGY